MNAWYPAEEFPVVTELKGKRPHRVDQTPNLLPVDPVPFGLCADLCVTCDDLVKLDESDEFCSIKDAKIEMARRSHLLHVGFQRLTWLHLFEPSWVVIPKTPSNMKNKLVSYEVKDSDLKSRRLR
jgi:hypothetical protein